MYGLACLHCDLLLDLPELQEGQKLSCPRCRTPVAAKPSDGLRRALAFAIAAAVLLAVANLFPFLAFKASGLEHVMTLPQSAGELYNEGSRLLALLVLVFIIIAPGLLNGALIVLLLPLVTGRRYRWLPQLGRLVFHISPWSMVEVFLIGVLVSFTKIASLATVVLGISFWAFAGFSLCLTAALASIDRLQMWSAIEEATA